MSEGSAPSSRGNVQHGDAAGRGGILGCLGRVFSTLLLVLLTSGIALLAIGLVYQYGFGFSLDTPAQIHESYRLVATLQSQNGALQLQLGALQTQVVELERRSSTSREDLDELRAELASISNLSQQLAASDARSATVVAEARASRDAVILFATAEAERVLLLGELKRRSDRIERFVQRLSDISSDTAVDLAPPLPGVPVSVLPTDTPELPTLTPADTPTLVTTILPTATLVDTPLPTPTMAPTVESTATPTVRPTMTRTPLGR